MKVVRNYFFLVSLFLIFSCNNQTRNEKLNKVANELIKTDFQPDEMSSTENIVFVGENLKEKISELKKQNSNIKFEFRNGDLNYPYGNFKADNVLVLDNSIQKVDIRLKFNSKKNKFDILGFKTE